MNEEVETCPVIALEKNIKLINKNNVTLSPVISQEPLAVEHIPIVICFSLVYFVP